ncbi:MAG: hypothetical protein U9R79_12415 [Armatimonadota bacterium]|nr:hypothetical protein [Armatimonadota bacterium]
MKAARCLVTVLMILQASLAGAELQVGLRYQFEPGASVETHVSARIDRVQMGGGVPLAVTGSAEADMTLTVVAVDEDGTATLRADFSPITSQLMGEAEEPSTPEPVELRVDAQGRVVEATGGGDVDLFATGGVPIHLIVLLAGVVELPEEPVALGEGWEIDRSRTVAEFGDVGVRATSRLERLTAEEAAFVTDVQASFPDFTAKNPLQDNKVTISNGLMTVEGMRRTIEPASGLPTSAEGRMSFNCMAAVGEIGDLPLTVVSSFEVAAAEPDAEEVAEPEAAEPEPPEGGEDQAARPRWPRGLVPTVVGWASQVLETLARLGER